MFSLKSCFTKRSFTFLPACCALSRVIPSYAFTPTTVPFKYETIGTVLRKQVEKTPQKDLFVFPTDNVSKTYSEFYEDANRFALGLLNLGLQPGDHVALWAPNVYEWTIVQFATALCGIVMVCINPASQPREIEYYFNKAKVKVVIAAEEFKLQNYYETFLEICPEIATHQFGQLCAHRIPTLRAVILIPTTGKQYRGTIQFSEIYSVKGSTDIDRHRLLDIERTLSPDSSCTIQFTSGTTGSPKAAILSHFGVVNNCIYFGRRTGMIPGTDYRACSPAPLFHAISSVVGSFMAVVNGGTFVMPAHSFDPLACLKAIEQENCTHFCGTPTMFIDVLNHPDFEKYDVSSLRAGFIGGAPVPIEVCKMAMEKLNMEDLVIAYGATETSPVTLSTALSDSIQKRTETVGFPLENTEVKIINEEGQTVHVGIPGEVCSRGYTTMLGYFDDDVQTKKAIGNDRWFKNIGIMSEEGYVKIVGRANDMIIRGGSNIYPTEIEDFLYSHPGIEEVQVVGVPDARLGEEVCAWIRLRPAFENTSIEEIKEYCKGKLTYYKIPKFIQFKKLEQFPMTASGKIQKFKIREMATKELGLETVC